MRSLPVPNVAVRAYVDGTESSWHSWPQCMQRFQPAVRRSSSRGSIRTHPTRMQIARRAAPGPWVIERLMAFARLRANSLVFTRGSGCRARHKPVARPYLVSPESGRVQHLDRRVPSARSDRAFASPGCTSGGFPSTDRTGSFGPGGNTRASRACEDSTASSRADLISNPHQAKDRLDYRRRIASCVLASGMAALTQRGPHAVCLQADPRALGQRRVGVGAGKRGLPRRAERG